MGSHRHRHHCKKFKNDCDKRIIVVVDGDRKRKHCRYDRHYRRYLDDFYGGYGRNYYGGCGFNYDRERYCGCNAY